jgi:general secretion pathway protein L
MKAAATITEGFSRWIDATAGAVVTLSDQWAVPHLVKLNEESRGEFVIQLDDNTLTDRIRLADGRLNEVLPAGLAASLRGSRVELSLLPDQLLFRQVELPSRAAEFLNGILRAQIDSLTPWNPANCAFGWSQPVERGADRIAVTVAATTLELIQSYVRALSDAGVRSVSIFSTPPDADDRAPIEIWEERAPGIMEVDRIRRLLVVTLVAAGLVASMAWSTTAFLTASLDTQQDEIAGQMGRARAAAGAAGAAELRSAAAALGRLVQRKQDSPFAVMVLEDLSRLLPDHTHLTELRIEGNKLRIIGITRDAPSLIGLLEQSGRFVQASFFAPTTRTSTSATERFHIEATLQPVSVSGS